MKRAGEDGNEVGQRGVAIRRRRSTILVLLAALFLITIGSLTTPENMAIMRDIFIFGVIVFLYLLIRINIIGAFKPYLNGIAVLILFIILTLAIPRFTIQLIFVLGTVATLVYIVFYLGIYTAAIDQDNTQGILSEQYLSDFAEPRDK